MSCDLCTSFSDVAIIDNSSTVAYNTALSQSMISLLAFLFLFYLNPVLYFYDEMPRDVFELFFPQTRFFTAVDSYFFFHVLFSFNFQRVTTVMLVK
jgi:hypothetical protein